MARRGWVSVTDPAGDRWRLAVFDDGWVELPGFGPAPSDGHIVQRTLLLLLGSLGVLVLLSQLAGRLDSGSSETSLVLSAAALAAVLVSVLLFARLRARDRSARAPHHRVTRRRVPVLRPVGSSAEYVARVSPGVRVGADDVRAVDCRTPATPADPVVVSVLLQDGSVRTYRTPDQGAVELFAPWTR
ncbi:hypothetical protein ASG36_04150 [Geodermatophilus sp. Leaf369]|uniref:hypothetical protein n=1 Tax=Geodermatophilus sp. Leaf369 TaxID=1736354 RepID=UPI0006F67B8F|nr:hypothetical protein [Geodermatophilus sp. Leaf369]KQS60179.1 hypothetical protein ASG36_04150 [Geodermatophilus sp. Leaf369]